MFFHFRNSVQDGANAAILLESIQTIFWYLYKDTENYIITVRLKDNALWVFKTENEKDQGLFFDQLAKLENVR